MCVILIPCPDLLWFKEPPSIVVWKRASVGSGCNMHETRSLQLSVDCQLVLVLSAINPGVVGDG